MSLTTFYAQSLPLGSSTTSSIGAPPSLEPAEETIDSLEAPESSREPCRGPLEMQQNLGFLGSKSVYVLAGTANSRKTIDNAR
jgi:hypothetical protein